VNRDAETIRRLYGRYDPARGVTANDQARDAAVAHLAELDSQPHVPETIDLPRGVRERQSARRRVIAPRWGGPRTRVAVAAAVAGVIAVGTTAAAVIMRSGTPATGTENSASARTHLLAAIERTGALSYSFSMMTRQATKRGVHPAISFTTRGGGEMAPSARKGVETLTSQDGGRALGSLRIRWLGPYEYLSLPGGKKPWTRLPSSMAAFPDGVNGISSGVPQPGGANPQNLLGLLASGYDVRPQGSASGNGWTGTRYAFAEKPGASGKPAVVLGTPGLAIFSFPAPVTGTVDVDSHGRVREFTEATSPLPYQKESYRMEITFGDFGIQVPVSAPPASQTWVPLPSAHTPRG
jgi:hypothetical protein